METFKKLIPEEFENNIEIIFDFLLHSVKEGYINEKWTDVEVLKEDIRKNAVINKITYNNEPIGYDVEFDDYAFFLDKNLNGDDKKRIIREIEDCRRGNHSWISDAHGFTHEGGFTNISRCEICGLTTEPYSHSDWSETLDAIVNAENSYYERFK